MHTVYNSSSGGSDSLGGATRGWWICCICSYRQWWVLGTEPRSFGRVTGTLNHWATFPAQEMSNPFKQLFYFTFMVCVCVSHVCLVPVEARRHQISRTGVTDESEPPCASQGLDLGLLKEQSVLLWAMSPSPYPKILTYFYFMYMSVCLHVCIMCRNCNLLVCWDGCLLFNTGIVLWAAFSWGYNAQYHSEMREEIMF